MTVTRALPLDLTLACGVVAKLGVAAFAAFLHLVNAVFNQRQIAALGGCDQLVHTVQVVSLRGLEFSSLQPNLGLGVGRRVVAVRGEQGPGLAGEFLKFQRTDVEFTRVVVFAVARHQSHGLQGAGKAFKDGAPLGHELVRVRVFGLAIAGAECQAGRDHRQGGKNSFKHHPLLRHRPHRLHAG